MKPINSCSPLLPKSLEGGPDKIWNKLVKLVDKQKLKSKSSGGGGIGCIV